VQFIYCSTRRILWHDYDRPTTFGITDVRLSKTRPCLGLPAVFQNLLNSIIIFLKRFFYIYGFSEYSIHAVAAAFTPVMSSPVTLTRWKGTERLPTSSVSSSSRCESSQICVICSETSPSLARAPNVTLAADSCESSGLPDRHRRRLPTSSTVLLKRSFHPTQSTQSTQRSGRNASYATDVADATTASIIVFCRWRINCVCWVLRRFTFLAFITSSVCYVGLLRLLFASVAYVALDRKNHAWSRDRQTRKTEHDFI